MAQIKTYKDAKAFRASLEERLNAYAVKNKGDINLIRQSVAFDRLIARLFSKSKHSWVLKGGFAMQLRIDNARATKDIDLALKEAAFMSGDPATRDQELVSYVSEFAEIDLGDFFQFRIGAPTLDIDAAPYGGSRLPVDALVDSRIFAKFSLDVGIGDVWIEPFEMLEIENHLEFVGIKGTTVPAISREQQFAEKLHTYTLPRRAGIVNSRVKDLVDMVLLIESKSLDVKRLRSAIESTYKRRGTHELSYVIQLPPDDWRKRFIGLAEECGITHSLDEAFELTRAFLRTIQP